MPPIDLDNKKDAEKEAKLYAQSERIAERTHRQLTKAPEKVVFKPVPVKPIEVEAERPSYNPIDAEHSAIEGHGALKNFFGIDHLGFEEGEKLRHIWGYLSEKFPSKPLAERLHQLRKMEQKMGQPRVGQTRLSRLHDYIVAQRAVEDAERWRDGVLGKI